MKCEVFNPYKSALPITLIPSTEPAQLNPPKFKVDKQPYLSFIDNLPQHPIQYEDFVPHFKVKPKKKRKIKRKL